MQICGANITVCIIRLTEPCQMDLTAAEAIKGSLANLMLDFVNASELSSARTFEQTEKYPPLYRLLVNVFVHLSAECGSASAGLMASDHKGYKSCSLRVPKTT